MLFLIKFAEAKLKADLSNYLDWFNYMKTYLTYYESWEITTTKPADKLSEAEKNVAEKANNKAYLIIEL